MTESSDTEAGSAAGPNAGLQIHTLLSRGYGTDAQVLLVLGSAPLATAEGGEPDVWVAIGQTEAFWTYARGTDTDRSIETARRLADAELQALDLERRKDERAFGLAAAPDRAWWIARFDLSDHPYARNCWGWVVQEQGRTPAPPLDVVCWQAGTRTRLDSEGDVLDIFEPTPGATTTASFAAGDVKGQPPFELGVLFVHGIGSRGERETLVHWSEPIVKFWRARAFATSRKAQNELDVFERAAIRRWAEAHALRNREPINGITEALGHFAPAPAAFVDSAGAKSAPPPMRRPAPDAAEPCCLTAKAEHTTFPDRNPGSPSATLFRLSSLDRSATLRESHVLFAESAWARDAFPPTLDELYAWLTDSIPIAVWARLERLATTRRHEIDAFAAAASTGFERFRVFVSRVLHVLQGLFLPTAYVLLALASQVVIALVGLLGLLPIPWLGRGIRWVASALMGTLGQSYALQTSPVRRSAIVSAVAQDIDWLSDRCHRLVVLSHSQGAEISRLAFLEARRSKMERWYTFGAGIAPLSMLSPRSLDTPASKAVLRWSKRLLAVTLLGVLVIAADSIPGVSLGIRDFLARATRDLDWKHLAAAWVVLSAALVVLCARGPMVPVNLRRSLLQKWTDFYASEDPVSGGSLQRRWTEDLKKERISGFAESRIYNTRFALLDHTTYWRNVEQFVAPIALDLLHYAGLGGAKAVETKALAEASGRRDRRTWWTLAASVLATGSAAALFLWIAFGPAGRATAWLAEGRAVLAKDSDAWNRLALAWSNGYFGMLARDLWPCVVLLALLVVVGAVSRRAGRESARTLIDKLAGTIHPAPPPGVHAPPPGAAPPPKETP